MQSIATRIARLSATSALILALGATVTTGSAASSYQSWAGSAPIDTLVADDATTDSQGFPRATAIDTNAADPLPGSSDVSGWRATSPAFTSAPKSATSAALNDAAAVVRSKGYTPDNTRHYKPWAKLRVLVATATGSASGNNQQAFFFVGRRYIGTATSAPTASLAYIGQTSTRVRLSYGVFGPGSGDCCPTSHRTVRFQWNGKRLVPLDRIP